MSNSVISRENNLGWRILPVLLKEHQAVKLSFTGTVFIKEILLWGLQEPTTGYMLMMIATGDEVSFWDRREES